MIRRTLYLFALLSLKSLVVTGQSTDSLFTIPDSARVFTLENFYELLVRNNPTARQANLLPEVAQQEIRYARGSFDPKLESQFLIKSLNGKEYYEIFNGALKIPTVLPFDPSIGIDQNKGTYLNPERYIDDEFDNRQLYVGISLPLGRGLITDERRAALRQAELFKDFTEAEKIKIINKLLLDAAKAYWDWYYAHYNYRLLRQSFAIADDIFRRIKTNYAFGEASAVDTIQAGITRQQRLIEQQEALVNFRNSGVSLSTMLWDSLGNPLELDNDLVPVLVPDGLMITPEVMSALADSARIHHPELNKIETKIQQLEVERRLAKEYLKPQLNLNYYALNQPINPNGEFSSAFSDNYKLGVDFSIPLFLRKERSKLALTKLKITNTQLEQSLTEREIVNGITSTYNQLTNLQPILTNQYQMVQAYQRLLEAELLNLSEGESDLFRINVQQEKLIQSQSKWLKLLSENEKLKAQLYWAAGSSRYRN
jgi:outer membrane protein TolC